MLKNTCLYFLCLLLIGAAVGHAENNAEYNKRKIEAMLALRNVSFTAAERWTIFFNFHGNSYGPYDERSLKYEIIKPLVAVNDIDALVAYANEATSGGGLPEDRKQNIPKGHQFYERAAQLGDVESMNAVAWNYLRGTTGDAPDERKALKWFIQYDQRHPRVETREIISKLYSGINPNGHGEVNIAPDKQKAKEWYQKAIELRNETGYRPDKVSDDKMSLTLARKKRLTQGAGDINQIMERFWAYKFQEYTRNVNNGDAQAARDLGYFFEKGFFSFRKDITHAVKFYQKAANLGDNLSAARLGELLIFEQSSVRDPQSGLRYLQEAYTKESNYYQRMRILEQIVKAYKYGPDEIRSARLAAQWTDREETERGRVRKGGLKMVEKNGEDSPPHGSGMYNCTDRNGRQVMTNQPDKGMKNCVSLGK